MTPQNTLTPDLIKPIAFFCCSLVLAGYTLWYRPMEADSLALFHFVRTMQLENRTMRIQNQEMANTTTPGDSISYLPTFLSRINEIGEKNGVRFKKFAPDSKEANRFELEFVSDYPTFLHFTSDIEALDLELDHMQIHPQDEGHNPPLHRIFFTIRPRDTARPLSGERIAHIQQRVRESGHRNPFQKPIIEQQSSDARNAVLTDLSVAYKLSGVGTEGETIAYATINHKNYRLGEFLDGMQLMDIQKGKVYLEKRGGSGVERFLIQYRKRSGQGKR